MVVAIIAAEIAFWVLIALGLITRYLARRPRLGFAMLAATPLVDVALLAAVTIDLASGGTATQAHALSAVYLGVSLVYGHSLIAWADVRFAHLFAGGPAPEPKSTDPAAKAQRERDGLIKHAKAWAIGVSILLLGTAVVGDAERTAAFTSVAGIWTVILVADGLFGWPAAASATRQQYR